MNEKLEIRQRKGFAITPNALLRDQNTKPSDKIIYTILASFTDEDRDCFPSMETIANLAGLGKNTVVESVHRLEESGWIRVKKILSKRAYRNSYHLFMEPDAVLVGTASGPRGSVETSDAVLPGTGRRTNEQDEEVQPHPPEPLTLFSDAPSKKKEPRKQVPKIDPDFERMVWIGDLGESVENWKYLYPNIDITQEMLNALDYAFSHPEKHYTRWYAYLSGWMRRQNGYATIRAKGNVRLA